ncbi:MAG TPA: DUF4835 family protein, partial [Flavisolibacter sp.]
MKNLVVFFIAFVLSLPVHTQELQARVSVMAGKVSTQVDRKIFQTLQTALTNFLNNRKWTTDTYQPQEKIKCSFLIT